jgi:transglutaminase-like putative cysteine protease
MRLKIEHLTTFHYDAIVTEAYTELRLKPTNNSLQRCLAFDLTTDPSVTAFHFHDRFGNDVRHFDIVQAHQLLNVVATSDVITPEKYVEPIAEIAPLDAFDFVSQTGYVPHTEVLGQFARAHEVKGDVQATAMALMTGTHKVIKYTPGATDVSTTAAVALELGKGVCQDFAHVMLAACRILGISARYVSGYLYVDSKHHDPNDPPPDLATHAWVDVFVPGLGWLALDPTHNYPQSERHVRVGIGRDYADVPPTRGTYRGQGREKLGVKVRITEL